MDFRNDSHPHPFFFASRFLWMMPVQVSPIMFIRTSPDGTNGEAVTASIC